MKKLMISALAAVMIAGCASGGKHADQSAQDYVKQFTPPPAGWAKVYFTRSRGMFAAGVKKTVFVNKTPVGSTGKGEFHCILLKPGYYKVTTAAAADVLWGSSNDIVTGTSGADDSQSGIDFIEGQTYYFDQEHHSEAIFGGVALVKRVTEPEEIEKLQDSIRKNSYIHKGAPVFGVDPVTHKFIHLCG